MNHLIRCYAVSWHPALCHMISVTQWLLQTHSSSVTLKTLVVWTQMMATWGMWYIDESFLFWIIPLTYQSLESIIWAYTTSFIHTCIYRMLNVFIVCLFDLSSRHHFLFMFSDSDLSIYMYLLGFGFTIVPLISIYVTGHCLYLYARITSLDHVHVWLPEHANCLYLMYSWVIFWQSWIFMSRSRSIDCDNFAVLNQSAQQKCRLAVICSDPLFF